MIPNKIAVELYTVDKAHGILGSNSIPTLKLSEDYLRQNDAILPSRIDEIMIMFCSSSLPLTNKNINNSTKPPQLIFSGIPVTHYFVRSHF